MDYARPVVWCPTRSKCIVIYVLCYIQNVWHKVTKCGFRLSGQKHRLAARCWWSCASSQRPPLAYHRGYSRNICQSPHSSDGQVIVNMKNLEQSLARCLIPTRHAIDSGEAKLHTASYTGLWTSMVTPGGRTSTTACICVPESHVRGELHKH